jgi:hypothetical protein
MLRRSPQAIELFGGDRFSSVPHARGFLFFFPVITSTAGHFCFGILDFGNGPQAALGSEPEVSK